MTLDDSVHAFRLRLMARAQALGNVSQACREFGISRSLFYRWRKRYLTYGPDGLHPRRTGARPGRPPTLSVQAERAILALAITWPTWGPLQLALQLRQPEHGRWQVAPSTVYRLLRRSGLQTRWERLAVLEAHSAQAAGLLTERTRRQLAAAQRRQAPHVQASEPGELVCLDTFYIGKLKGVGKVWQYTACDAACSYGIAQVSLEFSAAATAHFLISRVLPAFHQAGWQVQRVLTDQGNEFRGQFDQVCSKQGIRHTRTKPRHAWTNGFVERLHGTILQELWRTPALRRTQCGASVEFRRRFFTGATQMQTVLDRYLDFYNHRRAHQGYRTRGRTPGEIFMHTTRHDSQPKKP